MADKPLDNQSDPLDGLPQLTPRKQETGGGPLSTLPKLTPRENPNGVQPVQAPEAADPTEVKIRTEGVLERQGFDPKTIGRTVNQNSNLPDTTEAMKTYGTQTPEGSTPEARAAVTLAGSLEAEGTPAPQGSWQNIQSLMMSSGYRSVEGLAASRSWWMRSKKMFARAATPVVFFAGADFGIGMGLLDTFMWGQKKLKIQLSPAAQRAEMEQLLLPKVSLGGRDFTNAGTAALSIHRDRWWGGLQVAAGAALGAAGAVVPGPGQEDVLGVARNLREKGGRTWTQAMNEAPQIMSILGENPGWHEIVERHYDENGLNTDNYYAWLDRQGWRGDLLMGVVAVADVAPEIVMDPLLWAGLGAQKVAPALRGLTGALAPAKHAKIAKDVARATEGFEDAIDAVRAAEGNLAKVEARVLGRAVTRDGPVPLVKQGELGLTELGQVPDAQISREAAVELVQARRALANERQWLSTFEGAGPKSDIWYKVPKRSSEFLPESYETREFLENYPAETKDGVFYQGWRKVSEVAKRSTDDLAEEMTIRRHAEIERDADTVVYWDELPKESPQRQQRVLFGADDTEQAGDGVNHMTRTGGQGIDDVTLTPTQAEYGIIQDQGPVPIRDWRAVDAANDATKAEKEFLGAPIRGADGKITHYQGGSASGQYSLEMSTKRALSRQLDIAQRNYGLARRSGDKAKIAIYENEITAIKSHRGSLDSKGLDAADKEFVDWLPEHSPGIMDEPGRFNRWMAVAGDRVVRSAYPGGLHVQSIWNTRAGQVFAPLREPQRYYDTYSPGTWERVQGGYLNYEQATKVWSEEMLEGGLEAGVVVKRGKYNPKRHFSEYQLDTARNETLFDLLNHPANSEKWKAVAEKSDDRLIAFQWKIRERLDRAADQQGIRELGQLEGDDAPYITGYIKHFLTKDQFAGGARPPEYIGMPRKAEVFAAHLLHRDGQAGYPKDAWAALELYGRSMNRTRHIQPVYDEILTAGQEIAERTGNPFNKVYGSDLVAQLQGRPALVGQRVDQWLGGAINSNGGGAWKPDAIDRGLVGLTGLWWAGMLPGNPRYPLMQMVTGVSTTAGRFGLFRTIRGLTKQATREGQAASREAGVYQQFEKIFESSFMRQFSKFMTEKGISFGPLGIQTTATTEEFIRGATFHAATEMYMTKMGVSSWDELATVGMKQRTVWEGLRASQEVNHMFGALGRSPVVSQTIGRGPAVAATQFLSFIPKQTEELVAQFNRNPGNLAMYMAVSGWLSRITAQQLGMDITDYVGAGYLPDKPSDLTSPGMDTIIAGMDFLSAIDKGDMEAAAKAQESLLGSLDSMIPMLVAWKTGSRSAQELLEGHTTNSRGEFMRPLETGGVEFGIPRNEEGNIDVAAGLESFGRAMGPDRTGDLNAGAAPGVGGDLFPVLTGSRSIRENMFRRGQGAIIKDAREFAFEAQTNVLKLWNKIQAGEMDEAAEIEQLLVNKYNIVFEPGNQIERMAMAQELSWTLRALKDADDQLLLKVINEIRSNGISLGQ